MHRSASAAAAALTRSAERSGATKIIPEYRIPDGWRRRSKVGDAIGEIVALLCAAYESISVGGRLTIHFSGEVKPPSGTESVARPHCVTDGNKVMFKVVVVGKSNWSGTFTAYCGLAGHNARELYPRLNATKVGDGLGRELDAVVEPVERAKGRHNGHNGHNGHDESLRLLALPVVSGGGPAPEESREETASLQGFTAKDENVQLLILNLIERMGKRSLRRVGGELRDAVKEALERLDSTRDVSNYSAGQILSALIERELLRKATHPSDKVWRDAGEPYMLADDAYRFVDKEPPGFPPMAPPAAMSSTQSPPPIAAPPAPAAPAPEATSPPPTSVRPPSPAPPTAPSPEPPKAQSVSGLGKIEEKLLEYRGAKTRVDEIDLRLAALEEEKRLLESEKVEKEALLRNDFLRQLEELTK